LSEKFPVIVAPLKLVRLSVDSTAARIEFQKTYMQTPHLYMLENTDILSWPRSAEPKYLGISKESRWLTGWVYLDVLAKKYPKDKFLERCLDPKLRFEDKTYKVSEEKFLVGSILHPKIEKEETFFRQEIAMITKVEGRDAIFVRVVTPAKIKYSWWGGWHRGAYVAPV